jgi:hypothetical protein
MSNAKERILPWPERLRAYDLAQQIGLAVDQVVRLSRS